MEGSSETEASKEQFRWLTRKWSQAKGHFRGPSWRRSKIGGALWRSSRVSRRGGKTVMAGKPAAEMKQLCGSTVNDKNRNSGGVGRRPLMTEKVGLHGKLGWWLASNEEIRPTWWLGREPPDG